MNYLNDIITRFGKNAEMRGIINDAEFEKLQNLRNFLCKNRWNKESLDPSSEEYRNQFFKILQPHTFLPEFPFRGNPTLKLLKSLSEILPPMRNWFSIPERESKAYDLVTVQRLNAFFRIGGTSDKILTFYNPRANTIFYRTMRTGVLPHLANIQDALQYLPEFKSKFMKKMKHLYILPWPYGLFQNSDGVYPDPLKYLYQEEKPLPLYCRYLHMKGIQSLLKNFSLWDKILFFVKTKEFLTPERQEIIWKEMTNPSKNYNEALTDLHHNLTPEEKKILWEYYSEVKNFQYFQNKIGCSEMSNGELVLCQDYTRLVKRYEDDPLMEKYANLEDYLTRGDGINGIRLENLFKRGNFQDSLINKDAVQFLEKKAELLQMIREMDQKYISPAEKLWIPENSQNSWYEIPEPVSPSPMNEVLTGMISRSSMGTLESGVTDNFHELTGTLATLFF